MNVAKVVSGRKLLGNIVAMSGYKKNYLKTLTEDGNKGASTYLFAEMRTQQSTPVKLQHFLHLPQTLFVLPNNFDDVFHHYS